MTDDIEIIQHQVSRGVIIEAGNVMASDVAELRNQIDTANAAITDIEAEIVTLRASAIYADDYPTLQDAINAAEMPTSPTFVQLSAKTYTVTDTIMVPANVTVRGVAGRATIIKASASFPAKPVVQLGRSNQNVQHGCVLEDLTVSGNMRPGTTGVFTDNAHEPSGLRRVIIEQCMKSTTYVDSGLTPGHYSNHMMFESCEFFSVGSAATGATVDLRNSGNPIELKGCTINTYADSGKGAVALRIEDVPAVLTSCHFELHDVGADVYAGAGSKGNIIVTSLTGHSNMGHMVRFNDRATGVIMQLNPMGATSSIYDTTANAGAGGIVHGNELTFYVHKGTDNKPVRTISGAYNWSAHNARWPEDVILADCTSGVIQVNVPPANYNNGRELVFKKIDASVNALEVHQNTQTPTGIDGFSIKRITSRYGLIQVISDGSKWIVIGQHGTVTDVP